MAEREDSLTRRLRRYADVGANVGGLAARLAGERLLGLEIDRQVHAADLRRALGGLKGPIMKVAQMLATIPDALPAEYAAELIQLQSNAPAMGWPFVRRRMMAELGPDWRSRFAQFEPQAVAAASLGQVHRARAHDGRALAVKLQYANMDAAVEADLVQLRTIFALQRRIEPTIDSARIQEEIATRLREELDYDLEARHMALYGAILSDLPAIRVPETLSALSTRRLLTMTWLDGAPLLSFKGAPIETRNAIAVNLFQAWWLPFCRHGAIHGDPHLGNYSVRPDGGLNLLDYGCIRTFRPDFVQGVIDLYRALERSDRDAAAAAYRAWGFDNLSNELIDTLTLWARFIYGPMLDDRVRTIADGIKPGDYGRAEANDVQRRLRQQGSVTPPREFVFMDRAAIGLGGVFLHLEARHNWHRLFNEAIEGFSQSALAARQLDAFNRAGVPRPV